MAFASANIPSDKYTQTILYVLGTAGLRLLPKTDQDRIVSHLYLVLPLEYPFHLPKDGVQVIPGKLEGQLETILLHIFKQLVLLLGNCWQVTMCKYSGIGSVGGVRFCVTDLGN